MGALIRSKLKALGALIPSSAMKAAVEGESTRMAGALLDAGFSIERPIRMDQKMIHHAIYGRDSTMLAFAIERGADLNSAGQGGLSALSQALWQHNGALAEMLLNAGADPNRPSDGEPPLVRALLSCPQAIPALLSAGADPFAVGRVQRLADGISFDHPDLDSEALSRRALLSTVDREAGYDALRAAQEAMDLRGAIGSAPPSAPAGRAPARARSL